MLKSLFISILLLTTVQAQGQSDIMGNARKVNNYFMAKVPNPTKPTFVNKERPSNLWTRAVYYEGLMALYGIDPSKRYLDYATQWGSFHKWTARNGNKTTDADDQCCEQTYIDLYNLTGRREMIEQIGKNLDLQMATGRADYWTWIDAIQMAMPVYSKYSKLTGERKYMDYAMESYNWSRNTCGGGLFNTKEGLWWRDKDYVPPYKEADGNNCYWSRGNGWVYAALVRVMSDLDKKDPYYKQLKKDFLLMSKGLAGCQREDGYWNVSLVSPVTYGGICDKAWEALKACVHEDGFLGYNQGTGKDPSAGQPVTYNSLPDFEDYGTGCFLLGATEYYKLTQKK